MNEQEEPVDHVGHVDVRVKTKDVYKAVRNILANEMKLDPDEIKEEVRKAAYEVIKKEVIEQIEKVGYSYASLRDWAKRAMDARTKEVDTILKEVVKEIVIEKIRQQAIEVVEGIIKDGLTLRIGWNREIKVKVEEQK